MHYPIYFNFVIGSNFAAKVETKQELIRGIAWLWPQ